MTLAMGKDRNPALWLLAAMAGGPLATLGLLGLPATGRDPAIGSESEATELCDACEQPVRRDRATCRYCETTARPTP
jgi:hypothetical protein